MRIGGKRLSELTDQELEAELVRRRRMRGASRPTDGEPTAPERTSAAAAVRRANVRQWYANLELKPGASVDDVKDAYKRLMAKYNPEKHLGDPEKHRAATELARGLTEAYEGLLDHLRESR